MKLCICGICGRMGLEVLGAALERGHSIAGAFDTEHARGFGSDAGSLIHVGDLGVPVSKINEDDIAKSDGIIDFSSPHASVSLAGAARRKGKPLVIGTTGFNPDEKKAVEDAGGEIPVLLSPNMSPGVNLLFRLAEIAAAALPQGYDVEIFEAHHRFKKDAPSGTARRLAEIVKASMKGLNDAREVYGREGPVGERTHKEIGVLAMRGGDIVGDHTVFFNGMGERIELTHRATSRSSLAKGAVAAIEYLDGKPAGLYSMYDVLGFR
jgi:4-hydroxy-tetrahydrodipicolinate reductase